MNQSLFTSPELSAKLEKLGIESQFDFWFINDSELGEVVLNGMTIDDYPENHINDPCFVYHWSDLCLPENAMKIWGNGFLQGDRHIAIFQEKTEDYLTRIQFREDWQTWLEAEVDKKLAESL